MLVNAPLPQLPALVLNTVANVPLPEWVSDEWRERPFVEWIRRTYTDPAFVWMGKGQYISTSARRQVALSVAGRVDRFTYDDIAAVAPIDDVNRYMCLRTDVLRSTKGSRPWRNCLLDAGDRKWGELAAFTGVRCACERVATVVMRVPEVPRDLLCTCGRMPEGDMSGMSPDVRFPREYQDLQLPLENCIAELASCWQRSRDVMRPAEARVLEQDALLSRGVTEPELNAAFGVSGGGRNTVRLLNLSYLGFVERDDSRPAIWRYTELGKERAEQLARGEVPLSTRGLSRIERPRER